MKQKQRSVAYYFDSKIVNKMQVIKNLQREQEVSFFGKNAKMNVYLNEFGVYVGTLTFEEPKKQYGTYKETGTFKPYEPYARKRVSINF